MPNQPPSMVGRVGDWAMINVYKANPWTTEEQVIRFDGRDVHVLPQWDDRFPIVAVAKSPTSSLPSEWSFLSRFLSCLVWATQGRAEIFDHCGGTRISPMGGFDRVAQDFTPYHRARFPFSSLTTVNERQALGLAYWRQAGTLPYGEGGYAFL